LICGTCICFAGLLLFAPSPARAQQPDSLSADTIVVRKHDPRKAVIFSALLPGLGQVYNKKYWKVPIIYGAGGAFAYFAGFYQLKYKKFRVALFNSKAGDEVLIDGYLYPYENLQRGMDYYRRFRDLDVIGLAAIYLLNIIDAMIDANFFYYDVSDDLTMKIQPVLIQSPGITTALGFQVNFGF
jgi:hypothetical protein